MSPCICPTPQNAQHQMNLRCKLCTLGDYDMSMYGHQLSRRSNSAFVGVRVVGEAIPVWGQGLYEKMSVPSPQFFCELKTDLENKVFKINLCISQTCVTSQRLPTPWILYVVVMDLLILDEIYFFIEFLLGYMPVEDSGTCLTIFQFLWLSTVPGIK